MKKEKQCLRCGAKTDLIERKDRGRLVVLSKCRSCERELTKEKRKAKPALVAVWLHRSYLKSKARRSAGMDVDLWIYKDCRASDRKRERENDLTREIIRELIKDGCRYCGETDLRMTLDRIDNSLGHTIKNVVSACVRCNYARRDMPYEAWLLVVPGMREAREKGLFGVWTGRCR